MPRRRSGKNGPRPIKNHIVHPSNVLQSNKNHINQATIKYEALHISDISDVKPILDDDKVEPCTSRDDNLSQSTAALHDELDSFRQRWRRELEIKKPDETVPIKPNQQTKVISDDDSKVKPTNENSNSQDCPDNPKEVYALAKKLFLIGADLEQDELHHESIRYYKQAMHLCPDIERQIFREQCEASLRSSTLSGKENIDANIQSGLEHIKDENELPVLEKIKAAFDEDRSIHKFAYCRPAHKSKSSSKHIADLPHDLILQIFRYVIGKELDLASLESVGLVCRGYYMLSRDPSIWRSICYITWCEDELNASVEKDGPSIDWRQIYLTKPRVNYDGVYISRTRYIRQGDVGFQDITYRPFHIVRYYRYLRFFPDHRVLILTTNEDPDKIIPIFRHALHSKQFSSELSILEGVYELVDTDELSITAEKDFTLEHNQALQQTYNQRRQARFHWSRQTPLLQKFSLKFKLKTTENRPFKNNVLKWLGYSIISKTEMGQELTEFDLSPDTFPTLTFSRVKRFNLRLSEPLPSH